VATTRTLFTRVPSDVYRALKQERGDTDQPLQEIVSLALRSYLAHRLKGSKPVNDKNKASPVSA